MRPRISDRLASRGEDFHPVYVLDLSNLLSQPSAIVDQFEELCVDFVDLGA
jgi:hypothetical protein